MKLNSEQEEDHQLVTFIVVAYNQERFIRDAIAGAFSQTYTPLEIILSDDCSPDGTFAIMKEMADAYEGSHKVVLNRNEKNLRVTGHVNQLVEMATGKIIVLAAGDDISLPERAARSVELMSDGASAVSFSTHVFSKQAELINLDNQIKNKHSEVSLHSWNAYLKNPLFHLNGAARSFRKNIFEVFSAINTDCPTEDSVILLRSLMLGEVVNSDEVMVCYRVHENNMSSVAGLKKMNFDKIYEQYLRDMQLACQIDLLSPKEFKQLNKAMVSRRKSAVAINSFNFSGARMSGYLKYILPNSVLSLRMKARFLFNILKK